MHYFFVSKQEAYVKERKRKEKKRKKWEIKQKGMESYFGYGFLLWNSKVCMNFFYGILKFV